MASDPVVVEAPAARADAVDWRLVAALSVASVAMVAVLGYFYRTHPFADSAYFADRLLRLVAGGRIYRDFEFAYGPLLLLPIDWLWLVLRNAGADIYASLYASVAVLHVVGLLMAAYLLDRLDIPRPWRHTALVLVFAFGFFMVSLGPNYLPMRFLTPFVALVWTAEMTRKSWWQGTLAALVSLALAYAISPEMGIAAALGIVAALGLQAVRGRWLLLVPTVSAAIVGVFGFWIYYSMPGSTLTQVGGGAFNFPVLPGQPALVFVATMLALALGVGFTSSAEMWPRTALQLGWLVSAGVLMAAALGRADFGHIFFNGLGAFLLALAIVHRVWRKLTPAYLGVVAVVFVGIAFTTATTAAPSVFAGGVNAGLISKGRSMSLAMHLGRTAETGRQWYRDAIVAEPSSSDVNRLVASRGVFAPYMLQGQVGVTLAEKGALLPGFSIPGLTMTPQQMDRLLAPLGSAAYVFLPTGEYTGLLDAAKSRSDTEPVTFMRRPTSGTDAALYSMIEAFPLHTHPANQMYEPDAILGAILRRDWEIEHESGSFVILRRRSKAR